MRGGIEPFRRSSGEVIFARSSSGRARQSPAPRPVATIINMLSIATAAALFGKQPPSQRKYLYVESFDQIAPQPARRDEHDPGRQRAQRHQVPGAERRQIV